MWELMTTSSLLTKKLLLREVKELALWSSPKSNNICRTFRIMPCQMKEQIFMDLLALDFGFRDIPLTSIWDTSYVYWFVQTFFCSFSHLIVHPFNKHMLHTYHQRYVRPGVFFPTQPQCGGFAYWLCMDVHTHMRASKTQSTCVHMDTQRNSGLHIHNGQQLSFREEPKQHEVRMPIPGLGSVSS